MDDRMVFFSRSIFTDASSSNGWAPVDEQLARRGRESTPGRVARRQASVSYQRGLF